MVDMKSYKQIFCTVDDCVNNKNGDCFSDDLIPLLIEYRGCGNYEPRELELRVIQGGRRVFEPRECKGKRVRNDTKNAVY
ncbi:hypothetical protein Psfp_02752 [Pelotomaculum sp. FP]|nr:hypothetical protein Psfp_02752 [Pelotomaculum sp. FP]